MTQLYSFNILGRFRVAFLLIILFAITLNGQTNEFFKSPKYGYSFKYSNSFKNHPSQNPQIDFSAGKTNGASIITTTAPFSFSENSFDKVTQKTIEHDIGSQVDNFTVTKFIRTKISGYNAIIVYCDVMIKSHSLTQILVFVNSKTYPFTLTLSCFKKDFSSLKNTFEITLNSLAL